MHDIYLQQINFINLNKISIDFVAIRLSVQKWASRQRTSALL